MRKKKGSAILLTLVVVFFLMVLGTSLIMVSASSYKMEIANDDINKLNMMTESGVEVALAQVKKTTSSSSLVNIAGLKSEDKSITCDVTFNSGTYSSSTNSYITAPNIYTIESKAYNTTNSRTIRVPITYAASKPAGIVPTDKLLYINGDVLNGNFSCGVANGDIFVNGNFYFHDGVINGNVSVKGNLEFNGGTNINGNVQVDNDLIMPQGNIQKNATIGGNATFNGGVPKIGGQLYYKGTATSIQQGSTVSNFVPLGAIPNLIYTPLVLKNSILPLIIAPTNNQNAKLNTITSNSYTITDSGKLSTNLLDIIPWHSTLTFDTTSKDVSLLIDSNFKFDRQLKVQVTGTHNLYIYLTGNSSLTVESQFIGMQNNLDTTTKIYIIGDGNQSVILNSCELNAIIYIPNGSLSASGGLLNTPITTYMFQGSCVTKSVNIIQGIRTHYLTPNIIGTPLEVLNSGQSGSGSANWVVGNWSSQ
ncbi:polymer-forming cytoskeletal protein [Clostridium estertheticum]|uniref:polymer-forming cytoskeletal protein n=1 Tax=Clostridium estertheticum TaxID=238834 RepID=UPI001C7DB891|nr:polymer-forming cytoskeletal protein [Clostridium estertheticum]MBX4265795.1 polymer-forming cytoskeletal protein [Clostridium estertheticum]WLC86801.1 polymer-forming cytoskeletal protein [Clostridium estertheticum]